MISLCEVRESFSDQRNVSFITEPRERCREDTDLLLLVLSTIRRREKRDLWRRMVRGREGTRILFIIANTDDETESVLAESEAEGDLLFPDLSDGHERLSYKVLSGLVWAYLQCSQARYVAKTDDNVVLDLERLTQNLQTLQLSGEEEKFVACESPVRNTRWVRPSRGEVTSGWSVDPGSGGLEERVPDWCVGWLYLTTPRVSTSPSLSHINDLCPGGGRVGPGWAFSLP